MQISLTDFAQRRKPITSEAAGAASAPRRLDRRLLASLVTRIGVTRPRRRVRPGRVGWRGRRDRRLPPHARIPRVASLPLAHVDEQAWTLKVATYPARRADGSLPQAMQMQISLADFTQRRKPITSKLPAPLQRSASGRADPDGALPECLDSRAVVQCRHRALGAPCHRGGHIGPVVHPVLPVPGDARR